MSYINFYHSVTQWDILETIYVLENLLQEFQFVLFLFGKTKFSTVEKRRLMLCKYENRLMALENPNKWNHLPIFKQWLQVYGSPHSLLQAKHKYIAVFVIRKPKNQSSVFWIGVNITYFLIETTLLREHCCKLLDSS